MDTRTGKIYETSDQSLMAEMLRRGFEEVPQAEITRVTGMNRKQRRKWAAQQS